MEPARDRDAELGPMIRTAQIIAGALAMGVAWFLGITLFLRSGKGLFAPDPWDVMPPGALLTALGLGMAAGMVVLSFVVPRSIGGDGKSGADDAAIFGTYQTRMIVGLALLEGAAFFNGIAFLLEGRAPSLIAAAVLVLIMLSRFPTRPGVEAWIEGRKTALRDEEFIG